MAGACWANCLQIGTLKYKRNIPSNEHFNIIQPCVTCSGSSEPLSGYYITKVTNITTYATCNFFVSETSLIYNVPDDVSGEPKHVAYCCILLKCCVTVNSFVFRHSKCNGFNQYKKGTFGLRMLVLQSRDIPFDLWSHGAFAFKFSRSLHFVHFCARPEDCGAAVVCISLLDQRTRGLL